MSQVLRDSRGFSLIEVLAALFILGISAATVLGVFSTNMRLIGKSGDHIHATILARSLLEEAMAAEDIESFSAGDMDYDGPYTGEVEVGTVPRAKDGVEMNEVTVTVSWPPSGSVTLRGRKIRVEID